MRAPRLVLVLTTLAFACGDKDSEDDDAGGTDSADDTDTDTDTDGADDTDTDGADDTGTDTDAPPEDADGDGHSEADGDCDDADASTYPGATEVWYDGVDQDCDGGSDYDQDGDGEDAADHGGTDCDDEDPAINTAAAEIPDNADDEDCDGRAAVTGPLSDTESSAGQGGGSWDPEFATGQLVTLEAASVVTGFGVNWYADSCSVCAFGIYDDAAGTPGALLGSASGACDAVQGGTNTISTSAPFSVPTDGSYWIIASFASCTSTYAYPSYSDTVSARTVSVRQTAGTLPDPYGTPDYDYEIGTLAIWPIGY